MKKGEIGVNELLGFILALIGLVIIGYAIFKLYSVTQDSAEKNAQEVLDRLLERIGSLESQFQEEGEVSTAITIQGFRQTSGNYWYIKGWSINDEERPDKCAFSSCICVCPSEKGANDVSAVQCQEEGFCEDLDFDVVNVKKIVSTDVVVYQRGVVTIDTPNPDDFGEEESPSVTCSAIRLPENLVEILISINNEGVLNIRAENFAKFNEERIEDYIWKNYINSECYG